MKPSVLKTLTDVPHHMSINILFLVLNNPVFTKVSVTSVKKNPALILFYLADQK